MPYAEVNDIRMFYEETGTGQPLILMHGGTGGIDAMTGWPRLTGPSSASSTAGTGGRTTRPTACRTR